MSLTNGGKGCALHFYLLILFLSDQRQNETWTGSSTTMGPGKTSMTTYSKWALRGPWCGVATCWTASPQPVLPREQQHHWCGVCHLRIQGNGKTIKAQIWNNAQPRVPAQGNKISKPLMEKNLWGLRQQEEIPVSQESWLERPTGSWNVHKPTSLGISTRRTHSLMGSGGSE